jgi:hypothetical protein
MDLKTFYATVLSLNQMRVYAAISLLLNDKNWRAGEVGDSLRRPSVVLE